MSFHSITLIMYNRESNGDSAVGGKARHGETRRGFIVRAAEVCMNYMYILRLHFEFAFDRGEVQKTEPFISYNCK